MGGAHCRATSFPLRCGVPYITQPGRFCALRGTTCCRSTAGGKRRGGFAAGGLSSGFTGEQYALPEAVEALRALRRLKGEGEEVTLSAGDPLNLVGVLLPGERTSAASGKYIRFRDGVPITLAEEEAEAPRASPVPSPTYSAYSKLSRRSELNSSRSPSR